MAIRILVPPDALRVGAIAVRGDEHIYVGRVRRAAVGDAVRVFDGNGRAADATIAAMTSDETTLRVDAVHDEALLRPHIIALLPLIKGERMELALEKLVEVGVDDIVIYEAARAVVRLDAERSSKRQQKFTQQLAAAARQAGRARAPSLVAVLSFRDALAHASTADARWICHPLAEAPMALPVPLPASVAVMTGPEGGLSNDELAEAFACGFVAAWLGPFVLRAETAPAIAVAQLRVDAVRAKT